MQTGLIAIGFMVVIAVIAALLSFVGFENNPVIVCMLAWTVLLGVSQAQRLHVKVGNEAQTAPAQSAARFWLIRSAALVLSLLLGLTAYTQYLVREYELPKVYQWQAMAWVMGINRPFPALVEIPAGQFEMGSNDGDDDEKPVHTVTISQPFYMAETETTFAQYDYFIWQMKQVGFDVVRLFRTHKHTYCE